MEGQILNGPQMKREETFYGKQDTNFIMHVSHFGQIVKHSQLMFVFPFQNSQK